MSLQLILGSSGAGKSYRLYKDVIEESMLNHEDNIIVIVPEQFTMGTQEKIVKMHPDNGVLNVDIVSFQRLAYKVFEELGVQSREILDDTGKSLIIRKILENKKEELATFTKNVNKPGFVEEIKSAISEMLQYGVDIESLKQVMDKIDSNSLLEHKLMDIVTIYEGFKNIIEDKYIAKEEVLDILCKVIPQSKIIRDSSITLDGFTGFTPIQYRLISMLMEYCKKVTITVTIDSTEKINVMDGMSNIFYLCKNTISKLYSIADSKHIDILEPIIIEDAMPYRLRNSKALMFLEKNIFRYNNSEFIEADDSVAIFEGSTPKSEIAFAAGMIKELITKEGYFYRDFAIVSADIDTYGELGVNILSQNDIPTFLDYKRNVMGNLVVSYIRNALLVIEENFSYESVFGFLKTGFTSITREETDLLENYVLAMGIRGYSAYDKIWIRKSRSMEKTDTSVEGINVIREKFLNIFSTFKDNMKSCATVYDYSKALYEFLLEGEIERKTLEYAKTPEISSNISLKGEYTQVYGKIMELLDKFVTLLGDEKVTLREFNDILDAGFNEIKVGLIPQSKDAVIIGDIERTRLENVKVLFFVGVNDGIIPKSNAGGGIISEYDKEILKENNIELSMTEREKVFIQKFYLYLNMTKPSHKLYMSYSRLCADGEGRKMSYLLISMGKMFPNIPIIDENRANGIIRLVKIPKSDITWSFQEEALDENTAKELYGADYTTSISAIEKYSSCAFSHFISYGLRLWEREMYDIKATDIGNLFHNSLERFSQKLIKEGETFTTISEEKRKQLVEESVMEISTDYGNTILLSSERNKYMLNRVITMTDRTVWAIAKQLEVGKFMPTEYEKVFSYKDKVHGRIDRIDTYEDNDNVYVKIVDYKTGNSDFDLQDTYYGLKIQLITYMNAAIQLEKKKHPYKNIVPAALFYYNIKDPFVDDINNPEDAMLQELTTKGIVNSGFNTVEMLENKEIVAQRNAGATRSRNSVVLPVKYKTDGSVEESSNVLTDEKLTALSEYVDDIIDRDMENIYKGDIEVKPYYKDKKTGCDYCEMKALCGFDDRIPDYNYNPLKNISDEEIFKQLTERKED